MGSSSESEDRATELANRLEDATDLIVPRLDEEGDLSSEDEEAIGDALAEFADVAREADFEEFLRAAGFEDLPDDPEPTDLPGLVGQADEGEIETVHRLLGLRDLADEWGELESDERYERLQELFEGVSVDSGGSDAVESDADSSTAEADEPDASGATGEEAEGEDDEQSAGGGSFVDRLRDAANQLSETAAESVADGAETAEAAVGDDEAEEAEDEAKPDEDAEAEEDESRGTGRKSRSRRGRYSSMPSRRPDMQGVGRKSTMPRRKRD